MFKLIFTFIIFAPIIFAQPWVMFSDMDDTYLYDQASGQVYIRVKKGGKNYEDSFVKMGVIRKDSTKPITQTKTPQVKAEDKNEQQELLKKAQELQKSIQGGIFETTN